MPSDHTHPTAANGLLSLAQTELLQRVITTLTEEIGPRPATSTAEARAAAFITAEMRRLHLGASVQSFVAPVVPWLGLTLVALLGLVVGVIGLLLPLGAALLTGLLCLAAIAEGETYRLACWLRNRPSQNVIGTRAAPKGVRWRVVLLGRLDSATTINQGWAAWSARCLPYALLLLTLVLLALARWASLGWLISIPCGLLAWFALSITRAFQQSAGDKGLAEAGGLGAILAAVAGVAAFDEVEIWAVALGSGATPSIGLRSLLQHYPFPSSETLFINLPYAANGRLTLQTGRRRGHEPGLDQVLQRLFEGATMPPMQRGSHQLASATLRSWGYHAVSLVAMASSALAQGEPQTMDQRQFQAIIAQLQQVVARCGYL